MSPAERQELAQELGDHDAEIIIRFVGLEGKLETLRQSSVAAEISWNEWLQAIIVLQNWLENEKRDYSLERKLGYLHCTVEAFQNTPSVMRPQLSEATARMLAQYGLSD